MAVTMFLLGLVYVVLVVTMLAVGVNGLLVVLIAGGLAAANLFASDKLALSAMGARVVTPQEAPQLHAMIDRLCVQADLPKPKVAVTDTRMPNAFALGRSPKSATVCATTGIMELLSPAELEGVLAHELAHARHRDSLIQTPVVLLAGWLVEMSRIGGFLERALLFVLGPVAASIVQVFLSPKREPAADTRAALILGTPHPLADALVRIEQAEELVRFQASPVTEPLYIVNPFEPVGLAAMFSTHPPVGERVARLRALDPEWRDRLRAA
jgi:heat shock protein HtpX